MLWESLYLKRPEIEEFLLHVRDRGTLPWVDPMVAFAAYTGARRSEMLRALATDVDLTGRVVIVREKKRVKGKRSTRTAPSPRSRPRCCGSGSRSSRKACSCSASPSE